MSGTSNDRLMELLTIAEESGEEQMAPHDAFWLACSEVAKARSIVLVPVETEALPDIDKKMRAVAQAGAFRTRKVALKGDWWQQDNGHLLVFDSETEKPFALIFKKDKYVCFDPTKNTSIPLTPSMAKQFATTAYYFYRPFRGMTLGWRELVKFAFRGNMHDVTRLLLLEVFIGSLGLIVPIATSEILSNVVPAANFGLLGQFLIALFVSAIAIGMFEFANILTIIRLRYRLNADAQAAVWDRLLRLPLKFFQRFSPGDLVNRASGIDMMQQTITDATLKTFLSGIFSFLSFFLMFYYSPILAFLAVLFFLIFSAVAFFISYRQLHYERKIATIEGIIAGLLLQFLNGIAKLRVSGSEYRVFRLWLSKFSSSNRQFYYASVWSIKETVFEIIFLGFISVCIFAIVGTNPHAFNLRTFIGFTAAFSQFFAASFGLANVTLNIIKIIPDYERITPILTTAPELEVGGVDPGVLIGQIELISLDYHYEDQGILSVENVSLKIEPGKFVAIVGHTGSGKSTLLRLMLGLIQPQAGHILYDNKDLSTLNIRLVRQQCGVVLQNGVLLPGTILENIAGGVVISLEDAWEAARQAGLADVIEDMPMKMHTLLLESGKTLSAGQRQRLMIARALARKPKIIFLDEATSALDNTTQAQVMTSLEQLQVTRVVIAHRLTTIMNADKIYVMEAGKVVEEGDYQSLLAKQGVFEKLAKQQIL